MDMKRKQNNNICKYCYWYDFETQICLKYNYKVKPYNICDSYIKEKNIEKPINLKKCNVCILCKYSGWYKTNLKCNLDGNIVLPYSYCDYFQEKI